MKKLVIVLAVLFGLSVLIGIIASSTDGFGLNRLLNPGLTARFGHYGGGKREPGAPEPFDANAIQWGIRWFPTHVNFGPDNDTLLVSLCHVQRTSYCRIGKYRISDQHWDILPFEDKRTYRTPIFSPDGKWIVVASAPCNDDRQCDARDFQLMKMPPDGSKLELLADSVALYPSFAHNGKKLIYWRWNIIVTPGQPKYAGGMNLYQLDWATGKETALTDLLIAPGEQRDRPFFFPDGEKFIFSVDPRVFQTTNDAAFGEERRHVSLFVGSMQNIPITTRNYLEAVQPVIFDGSNISDIDGEGRLLYAGGKESRREAGSSAAIAIGTPEPNFKDIWISDEEIRRRYPYAKLTDEQLRAGEGARMSFREMTERKSYRLGQGIVAFLRELGKDATDEAAFDVAVTCSMSLSPDSRRLAVIGGDCRAPSNRDAIVLIDAGRKTRESDLILNWPKLDLIPTQPTVNP